jgi:glycolate oxidase FAD binding subunit
MGSPHEVSGAAHLPGRTALRVEGVAPSVEARLKGLRELLSNSGARMEEVGTLESRNFWREIRDAEPLGAAPADVVWRISCAPTEGAEIVARIKTKRPAAKTFYDWSGGLIWLSLPASVDADHALVREGLRGHATLIRAPESVRAAVPVFQPLTPALAALSTRVKESFDPKSLFNPGRMG